MIAQKPRFIPLQQGPDMTLFQVGPYKMGFTHHNHDIVFIQRQFPDRQTIELKQTHSGIILPAIPNVIGVGADLCVCPMQEGAHAGPPLHGDGLLASDSRYIPVIHTADCIPLFFWHRTTPWFGILHIGWRGFVAKIQRHLLNLAKEQSQSLQSLYFLIGPGICAQHYPVGGEVIAEFRPLIDIGEITTPLADGRSLLDVKKAIRLDLIKHGIDENQIGDVNICTFERADDLPSYRRMADGQRIHNFILRD